MMTDALLLQSEFSFAHNNCLGLYKLKGQ